MFLCGAWTHGEIAFQPEAVNGRRRSAPHPGVRSWGRRSGYGSGLTAPPRRTVSRGTTTGAARIAASKPAAPTRQLRDVRPPPPPTRGVAFGLVGQRAPCCTCSGACFRPLIRGVAAGGCRLDYRIALIDVQERASLVRVNGWWDPHGPFLCGAAGVLLPRWGESRLRSQSLPSDPALDQLAAQTTPVRPPTGSSSLGAGPAAACSAGAVAGGSANGGVGVSSQRGGSESLRGSGLKGSGLKGSGLKGSGVNGGAALPPPVPVAGARPRSGPCGPPQRGQSGPTVVSSMHQTRGRRPSIVLHVRGDAIRLTFSFGRHGAARLCLQHPRTPFVILCTVKAARCSAALRLL